jgi:hypothetical protein
LTKEARNKERSLNESIKKVEKDIASKKKEANQSVEEEKKK